MNKSYCPFCASETESLTMEKTSYILSYCSKCQREFKIEVKENFSVVDAKDNIGSIATV